MSRNFGRFITSARGLNVILGVIILVLIVFLVGDIDITPGSVINTPSDLAKCFPTCADDDGRFLALAGSGIQTLAGQNIDLQFVVEDGVSELKIYVFDGDMNKKDVNNPSPTWDAGVLNTPVTYSVFADPEGNGGEEGGTALVTESSGNMANNDWSTIIVPVDATAQGADGRYYFQLHMSLSDPSASVINHFKIGTNDDAELYTIPEKPFAFQASVNSQEDINVIYEGTWDWGQNSYSSTTYDGTFTFYFQVPDDVEEIYMADGDMDRSDIQMQDLDTDDLNTPPTQGQVGPQFPLFVSQLGSSNSVVPEGVAVGLNGGTGNPNDDNPAPLLRRDGAISYVVSNPNGSKSWANDNPSGNLEWEVFLISTTQDPPISDYRETGNLQGGVYKVVINGMDMNNLNAWYFAYSICAVDVNGNPTCGQDEGPFEGCTPGYWRQERQHGWAWDPDNSGDTYLFEDSFETIFGLSGTDLGPDFTLIDAVNNTGDGAGPGQLARHATAALLNINNDGVNYPISQSDLISQVQAAFAAMEYENLKNVLDGYNNLGCDLGNSPN